MKSNNCTLSDFNKTKKSFDDKKTFLNNTNLTNFRETLNVFAYNNMNHFEKRNSTVNIKVREKQEYEFPNIKTMQKELAQKIYTKESGDIITAVKESNDTLRNINNTQIKTDYGRKTTMDVNMNILTKKDTYSKKMF